MCSIANVGKNLPGVSLPEVSLATLPFSPLSLYTQKCIISVSVLYKARENCIYTCKNIYLRVIHLFTSNIAEKKANKLYNCELYNCSEIQFFLALYNRSVYIVFLFLYKARKTYIFLRYTYNYAIYIHFNSIQLYAKLIIQLQRNRPANYTI